MAGVGGVGAWLCGCSALWLRGCGAVVLRWWVGWWFDGWVQGQLRCFASRCCSWQRVTAQRRGWLCTQPLPPLGYVSGCRSRPGAGVAAAAGAPIGPTAERARLAGTAGTGGSGAVGGGALWPAGSRAGSLFCCHASTEADVLLDPSPPLINRVSAGLAAWVLAGATTGGGTGIAAGPARSAEAAAAVSCLPCGASCRAQAAAGGAAGMIEGSECRWGCCSLPHCTVPRV